MKRDKEMDEITDLGEALVAIIQSPPGTWVDKDGAIWKWEMAALYWGYPEEEDYVASNMAALESSLPLRRIRYGWVPCEREEAFQLPDGLRVFMGEARKIPALAGPNAKLDEDFHWVKWGKLK